MASERPASGTRTPLPEKVDVAIVGGGIIGASIAWNLATRTDLSVALLDRETVGSGSTSRSAAAFRQQFSSVQHVRMSKYSAEAYRDFPQTFGVDPVFVQNGYLFLYTQAADLEAAAKRVDLQHREGVADAAVLAPADVEALPGMGGVFRTDHLAGATWCPSDGFLRPLEIAMAYADAAKKAGASVHANAVVADIEVTNGKVASLEVNGVRKIECGAVIVAAGWWSTFVTSLAGCPIPVTAVKRYLYITPQFKNRHVEHFPLIVGDVGPYMRPESNGLMMGWDERPKKPAGADSYPGIQQDEGDLWEDQDAVSPGFGRGIEDYGIEVLAELSEFVPFLGEESGIEYVTCGYYEITPDDKAILGEDPRVQGLWHASGFSGHGIMHAPAAGRALSDMLAGETPPFDMSGFALQPLLDNQMRPDPERMVI